MYALFGVRYGLTATRISYTAQHRTAHHAYTTSKNIICIAAFAGSSRQSNTFIEYCIMYTLIIMYLYIFCSLFRFMDECVHYICHTDHTIKNPKTIFNAKANEYLLQRVTICSVYELVSHFRYVHLLIILVSYISS